MLICVMCKAVLMFILQLFMVWATALQTIWYPTNRKTPTPHTTTCSGNVFFCHLNKVIMYKQKNLSGPQSVCRSWAYFQKFAYCYDISIKNMPNTHAAMILQWLSYHALTHANGHCLLACMLFQCFSASHNCMYYNIK